MDLTRLKEELQLKDWNIDEFTETDLQLINDVNEIVERHIGIRPKKPRG